MTRDEAVGLIARRLGNRTDISDAIVEELKAQQDMLERQESVPWFLLSEEVTGATIANEERVALPSDFIQEPEEESALWIRPSSEDKWIELPKAQLDSARARYTGLALPKVYALSGGYFRLLPTPDQVYGLKMLYYAKDQKLTTNMENKWLKYAPAVLYSQAGVSMAGSVGNAGAMQLFAAELATAKRQLVVENTARLEANRSRFMGERP